MIWHTENLPVWTSSPDFTLQKILFMTYRNVWREYLTVTVNTHPEKICHIFAKTIDNKKYVLTRSQHEFEKWERKLFQKSLFILFAISLVSFGFGFWMAKRSFRPIDRLMNETRQLNQELKEGRLGPDSFSGMWEKNEIGELAESFRITTSRLRQLLMGERQFASEVSHELRTPLTVMSTSIELLGNSENLNDHERQIDIASPANGLANERNNQHIPESGPPRL